MNSKLFWEDDLGSDDMETVRYLYSAADVRRLGPQRHPVSA